MFWEQLKPDDQEAIRSLGTPRTYEVGTRLFLHGDTPSHVVIIQSGLVKVTRSSTEGREVMIELRGKGSIIGEQGAIDTRPRWASGTVIEEVNAIVVPAPAFRELLESRASVTYAVLTVLSDKLRQATDRTLEAGVGDTLARLCGRLVELAEQSPTGPDGVIEIHSPLTQQELGEWIGVSRDAIVLALRRIRDLGWVETGRRTIRVLDLDALRNAAID